MHCARGARHETCLSAACAAWRLVKVRVRVTRRGRVRVKVRARAKARARARARAVAAMVEAAVGRPPEGSRQASSECQLRPARH